jgi:hypothetical protein
MQFPSRAGPAGCTITLTPVQPTEPDEVTATLLRSVFGPKLTYLEQGWLLFLAEGTEEPPTTGFGAAPGTAVTWPFLFVGPLDQVTVSVDSAQPVSMRLAGDWQWRTMRILRREVLVPGQPMAGRYVSLLADRFDERGRRVERVAATRCAVGPFDSCGTSGTRTVADVTSRGALWWWGERVGVGS